MTGKRTRLEAFQAYLYLSPSALIFLAFTLLPAFYVLYIGLFNWNFLNTSMSKFVGFSNYTALLKSPELWHSLIATFYFVLGSVPVGIFAALFIALLLMRPFRGLGLVRLMFFAPYVTPVVSTSIVWLWLFNPQFGLFNAILHFLHLPQIGWVQSARWAMPSVILYTLWHTMGFNIIIFMAGLTTIPSELGEVARIDGASAWQEFWHVTWPLLTPTTLFVTVINTIGALQAFTQFFTLTNGGPAGSTTTASFLLFQQAFVFYHTGYAAALAVLLFIIIAALTLVQMRVSRSEAY
ncbi:lactose transport system permease protein LacF [Peptococcaceae bacterium CEB3]|nr:lactose transport system permease protein LacF [Peptococcaceae bacterium CEB3]